MPNSGLLTLTGMVLLIVAVLLYSLVLAPGRGGLPLIVVFLVTGLTGVTATLIGAIAVGVRVGVKETRER